MVAGGVSRGFIVGGGFRVGGGKRKNGTHGFELGGGELVDSLVGLDFIFEVELFQEPGDALRAGLLEPVLWG